MDLVDNNLLLQARDAALRVKAGGLLDIFKSQQPAPPLTGFRKVIQAQRAAAQIPDKVPGAPFGAPAEPQGTGKGAPVQIAPPPAGPSPEQVPQRSNRMKIVHELLGQLPGRFESLLAKFRR